MLRTPWINLAALGAVALATVLVAAKNSGSAINTRALVVGSGTVLLVVVARRLVARYRLPRVDMLVALVVVSGLAFLAGWSSVLSSGGKPVVPVVGRVSTSRGPCAT